MASPAIKPSSPARSATTPLPTPYLAMLNAALDSIGAVKSVRRGHEIYGENEPAEFLYKVLSGTVRTSKVLSDGRRQIGAFYCSGELFGLEFGETYSFSAEAVGECTILAVDRHSLNSLASRNNKVAYQLWLVTAAELERAHRHITLLIKTAQERVAMFLLQMGTGPTTGSEIDLPMSRQDIADYLGLTIETVSRTITQFAREAAIEVPTSRHILVHNRAALQRLND